MFFVFCGFVGWGGGWGGGGGGGGGGVGGSGLEWVAPVTRNLDPRVALLKCRILIIVNITFCLLMPAVKKAI